MNLRDDAFLSFFLFSHHRVGLASTSLAISKYANVVAFEGVLQHLLPDIIVHLALRCKAGVVRL